MEKEMLSPYTEQVLTEMEYAPIQAMRLRSELTAPSPAKERFIVWDGGDYVWCIGREIYRHKHWPIPSEENWRLVYYDHACWSADDYGVFASKAEAEAAKDEYFAVLAARKLLGGGYDSTDDMEFTLAVVDAGDEGWEDRYPDALF